MISLVALRKSSRTLQLLEHWVSLLAKPEMVIDVPTRAGLDSEHPNFEEHRHDQSLWSMLLKANELIPPCSRPSSTDWVTPDFKRQNGPYFVPGLVTQVRL